MDPQAGAVLEREGSTRKVVGRGVAGSVIFVREMNGHLLRGQKSINCWRRWAAQAKVLTP